MTVTAAYIFLAIVLVPALTTQDSTPGESHVCDVLGDVKFYYATGRAGSIRRGFCCQCVTHACRC